MHASSTKKIDEIVNLTSKLVKIEMSIKMTQDSHVPNTMILMRVLPSVAVVNQSNKVERAAGIGTILNLYIKFLPKSGTLYKNLIDLMKMVKGLPGVKIVKVNKVGGRPVTFKGQPIVL